MENPPKEIADVVRSVTEPYESFVIVNNVQKYFTEDSFVLHPLLNQPHWRDGRKYTEGIYKMMRTIVIHNKVEFHAIMFNEDLTQGTLDLTMSFQPRLLPYKCFTNRIRYITRFDLRKEPDNKYRISRQEDNFPTDISSSGLWVLPGVRTFNDIYKAIAGISSGVIGRFLMRMGWFGP